MVKERESWRAAVHGVAESDTAGQLNDNLVDWSDWDRLERLRAFLSVVWMAVRTSLSTRWR